MKPLAIRGAVRRERISETRLWAASRRPVLMASCSLLSLSAMLNLLKSSILIVVKIDSSLLISFRLLWSISWERILGLGR